MLPSPDIKGDVPIVYDPIPTPVISGYNQFSYPLLTYTSFALIFEF